MLLLLDKGVSINSKDLKGQTPLHLASKKGYLKAVTTLLDSGADINALDDYGCTSLIIAVMMDHIEVVYILLRYGANMSFMSLKGETVWSSVQSVAMKQCLNDFEDSRWK